MMQEVPDTIKSNCHFRKICLINDKEKCIVLMYNINNEKNIRIYLMY